MKVVLSYRKPDLDGISCMFAYSELLNKLGIEANYYIWGEPKSEVLIVCDIFNIKLQGLKEVKEDDEFIAVDMNGLDQMPSIVNKNNLIEIIDHHSKSKYVAQYVNTKMQIEILGAAATIVAERYRESNIKPSRESAILLYYGIISNSINLKSQITSPRDIEITKWLKEQCSEISEEKIEFIFMEKSKIDDNNLRVEMECEIPLHVGEKKIIVSQLEVANLEDFLKNKKDKIINILKQVKKEKQVDYIYINCVDIFNGYTIVFGIDEKTNNLIERVFGIKFENGIGKVNYIIQRKEMTRKLRDVEEWN